MRRLVLAFALASLAGCASLPRSASWQAPLSANDAKFFAVATVHYLHPRWPAAATTVWIAPAVLKKTTPDTFGPALATVLRRDGYAVAGGPTSAGAHTLRYRLTRLGDGVLLRFDYDRNEAVRYYRHDTTGHWTPVSPFTVREMP